MSEQLVRAAGGLVVRHGPTGLEVAVVHRPRYDDWSFPKGKRDAGESDEDTALREVEEETGLRCVLGAELGETRYRDSRGRPKVVRYWCMELAPGEAGGGFEPNHEVDELRWCSPDDAATLLTYQHDQALLRRIRGRT